MALSVAEVEGAAAVEAAVAEAVEERQAEGRESACS